MSEHSQQAPQLNRRNGLLRVVGFALIFSIVELIIFAPLVILAQTYAFDSKLGLTCLQLLLCFVLGSSVGQLQWLNRKGYELLLCVGIGYGFSYLLQSSLLSTIVSTAIGALLVFRGIRYTKDGWLSLYPPGAFVISGVMYFIGVPIMVRTNLMHPYVITLNAAGFCSLILYFFITNRAQLLTATLAGNDRAAASSLSQTVKRSSRIWLIVFIAIIAAVGYFQQVKDGLLHLIHNIVAWLLGLMSSDAPPEVPQPSPSATPPMQFPPSTPHEPGWFGIFMQYVQLIFGYLLVIALVLGCIYVLIKKLVPAVLALLRRFMNRSLRQDQGGDAEGYTDEKETLVDWKELPLIWWQKASSTLRRSSAAEPTWAQQPNNQERIRFLYRLLIGQASKRGYAFKKSLTPNETGRELTHQTELSEASVHTLTSAYNRVRYGRETVTDEQLAQVLQSLDPNIRSLLK